MNAAATFQVSESLCSTCNHASGCLYLAEASSPIWRCADFDDSVPTLLQRSSVALEIGNDTLPERAKPAGICSNCDELATCLYPKPEGGVWRCEEYR